MGWHLNEESFSQMMRKVRYLKIRVIFSFDYHQRYDNGERFFRDRDRSFPFTGPISYCVIGTEDSAIFQMEGGVLEYHSLIKALRT
jgi:hypothetical protein